MTVKTPTPPAPLAKNEARELAVIVLAYLDLEREVAKARDGSAGLARVRHAEADLRRLCRVYASDDRPGPSLFG